MMVTALIIGGILMALVGVPGWGWVLGLGIFFGIGTS